MNSATIHNFGRNLLFRPRSAFAPRSEAELLEVLRTCRGRRIRVIGRLHSWSEAPVADDVLLDLRHLQGVRIERRGDRFWVTAGAGCQIKRLLAELAKLANVTLPTLGLVTEQSIAGAISTGTHGSGRSSMSHFMDEVRIATYDPATGNPIIRTINAGDELRAARCSLGALGVIVSVGFWARPRFRVEEFFRQYSDLDSVLAREDEFALQQFFLMPWSWHYIAQHRRETTSPRSGWASLYRYYCFLQFDIGLHLLVLLAARWLRSPRLVRFLFQRAAPRMAIQNWLVVDDSNKMLIMEHELFRHIECEIFVPRSRLREALDVVIQFLKYFGGNSTALTLDTLVAAQKLELPTDINTHRGTYTHHYPICIRRVLPDDTLISMTAGSAEPYYAVSFISYARPTDRQGFLAFATVLSRVLAAKFAARPHWGKVNPLTATEIAQLYPLLSQFRQSAQRLDPAAVFRNDWLDRSLMNAFV